MVEAQDLNKSGNGNERTVTPSEEWLKSKEMEVIPTMLNLGPRNSTNKNDGKGIDN